MRLRGIIRRIRYFRIIAVLSGLHRKFGWMRISSKHIKVDDEENVIINIPKVGSPALPSIIIRLFLSILFLFVITLSIAYVLYKPPTVIINYLQWKYPDVVFHFPLPSSQKYVALTLDDVPSSETAKILDLLQRFKAKATFFVIGSQISDYPQLLTRIHNEGHEIGIHGWADEPSYKLSSVELEHQIKKIETMLPINPDRFKWFRPGSGWFTTDMIEKLKSMGYKIALGNIYPHDPQIGFPKINAAHVLSMIKPGGVIIMHDRRPYSSEQLELVLQGLATRGWRAQTLSKVQEIKTDIVAGKLLPLN
ncbi:Peptidoglycan-N-acetylmuramic acid deacetylase PdaC [Golovinomyces cichoracearum]|uniref:chitin deacetylase n=1 Tax=Golovinomyces cichoracearum TaxID=62708 RepID=A0A420IVA9_9PEZI|nr:Peptidoglycan-N-acetylmuramic acid deacetylase PdaC [Golovinomyces cichoracearum]